MTERKPHTKGKRGLIYLENYKNKKIIIKTKNPESSALNRIENEANFLKKLNNYGIGPKFIFFENNELGMEYIEGELFEDYIQKNDKKKILKVIKIFLSQLYQMDKLGINKEEMHHPFKHIIIRKDEPILIDFERCHYTERPKNVTQCVQYLTSNNIICLLSAKEINIDKMKLIGLAKEYKEKMDKKNFEKIIGNFD